MIDPSVRDRAVCCDRRRQRAERLFFIFLDAVQNLDDDMQLAEYRRALEQLITTRERIEDNLVNPD